jgi:hypothetical protein
MNCPGYRETERGGAPGSGLGVCPKRGRLKGITVAGVPVSLIRLLQSSDAGGVANVNICDPGSINPSLKYLP